MTVTVTMTIPLRASRASLDSANPSLSRHTHLLIPIHIPYPHPGLCRVRPPCAVGSASRSFILNFLFFYLCWWLSGSGRMSHHCTQWPKPTPLNPPYFWSLCLFIPWHLPYPRVHRPPKSREACKDHGASEWRALGWIKEYPPFMGGPRAMATLTGWARQAQPCLGGVPVV